MADTIIDHTTLPVAERDQALGAYMESWSAVEKQLLQLTYVLLRTGFGEARIVFASISGNAQLRELLLALGGVNLTSDEQRELERILDRLKTLATRRNRIVHGEWIAHLDNPRAPTRLSHWVRHYHTADYETFMGALTGDDQKAAANHSFTVPKIQELAADNLALRSRLDTFTGTFRDRFQPKTRKRTYERRSRKSANAAPIG